jgi:uncharacterized repeat protein (TIGR03803 family)
MPTYWWKSVLALAVVSVSARPQEVERRLDVEVLYPFELPAIYGANGLTLGADSNFYGTTSGGGDGDSGLIFRFHPSTGLTVVHQFQPSGMDGRKPATGLVVDGQGGFYGTTYLGGEHSAGTVFHFRDGTVTTLHQMNGGPETWPQALSPTANGDLLISADGSSPASYGAVLRFRPSTGTMTVLKNYSGGNPTEGILPVGAIEATDGNVYGVAGQGGTTTEFGSVFRMAADGSAYTTLHTFQGPDGAISWAGLIQGVDGLLYGATGSGGRLTRCLDFFVSGCGVVYRIAPTGASYEVLHKFTGHDGSDPYSPLFQASDNNFYGTTYGGGPEQDCPGTNMPGLGCGTIFRLTPSGRLMTLYRFAGPDGANPRGALIEGPDGYLYGTTDRGGQLGGGTIFRFKP